MVIEAYNVEQYFTQIEFVHSPSAGVTCDLSASRVLSGSVLEVAGRRCGAISILWVPNIDRSASNMSGYWLEIVNLARDYGIKYDKTRYYSSLEL